MSFIKTIAKEIITNYGQKADQLTIIFPNRRAGTLLSSYLSKLTDTPMWSPRIITISEFIKGLSTLTAPDKVSSIYILYRIFEKETGMKEPFDQFYFWGETLLNDFDEVDKYLVDAESLFKNLSLIKSIDKSFDFLTEEQVALIKRFWAAFEQKSSKQTEDYARLWDKLLPVYHQFKHELKSKGWAYDGMVYREIATSPEVLQKNVSNAQDYWIAGFNALSTSEMEIFQWLVQERNTRVFWDVDDYYLHDTSQEAGRFFRLFKERNDALGNTIHNSYGTRINRKNFQVNVTGASLQNGQVQAAMRDLEQRISERGSFELDSTAIVFTDEKMLYPLLNALPSQVTDVNITMGFPLKNTLAFSLVQAILSMYGEGQRGRGFYYKYVLELLGHPFVQIFAAQNATTLIRKIKRQNIVNYIHDESGNEFIDQLFEISREPKTFLDQLAILLSNLSQQKDRFSRLDLEALYNVYKLVNRFNEFLENSMIELDLKGLGKILKQQIKSETMPFEGATTSGLQVMGLLETRNLSFKNTILVGANEGKLPPGNVAVSFIPYSIRKAFEMPTFEQLDAIFSYLFYRLVQSSENLDVYYNHIDGNGFSGELSRFVRQLEQESSIDLRYVLDKAPVKLPEIRPITVYKDNKVMDRMKDWVLTVENTQKEYLSATAINSYLECKLRFYFRYLLKLKEPDLVQEEIDPMVFGNILHNVMELLYQPMIQSGDTEITEQQITEMERQLPMVIPSAFKKHYHIDEKDKISFKGKSIIAREIIELMSLKVLENDRQYAPFQILGVEMGPDDGFKYSIPVMANGENFEVGLMGIADRVDRKGDVVRILDYKTGRDNRRYESMESLFDATLEKRNKAAFQTFYYGLLYDQANPGFEGIVQSGLFNIKGLFRDDFNFLLQEGSSRKVETIDNILPRLTEFKEKLQELLVEIFDPKIPFGQTEVESKCGYCPYNTICGRK